MFGVALLRYANMNSIWYRVLSPAFRFPIKRTSGVVKSSEFDPWEEAAAVTSNSGQWAWVQGLFSWNHFSYFWTLTALSRCTAPPGGIMKSLFMVVRILQRECSLFLLSRSKRIINKCHLLLSLSREFSFSVSSVVFFSSINSFCFDDIYFKSAFLSFLSVTRVFVAAHQMIMIVAYKYLSHNFSM